MFNINDFFEKISLIISVPVQTMILVPLIIAASIQAIRIFSHKEPVDINGNFRKNREYLSKKNGIAAILSLVFVLFFGYITYMVYSGEPIDTKNLITKKSAQ